MTVSPPRWAWAAAAVLFIAALGLFVFGRGGTVVLGAVALGFGAVAVLLLSTGDALPDADDVPPPDEPA